ncbi:potassium transporter Kup [Solirhodobacter olei]|uniref:potassium transporter Kup n=1 Tax=Solirhodobacter olei TaxID=2493082 RepID=UPI000FD90378|nr:potassium transporter Kup [Solirhodobacter olei]
MIATLRDVPDGADVAPFAADDDEGQDHRGGLFALTLGAVGVVYGDIGTSPIYAVRESLRAVSGGGLERSEVIGVISTLIWTLVIIVTLKYVTLLLRADNRGEGGVLALYTLVRLAIGRRSFWVLALGIAGAALFFGDAIITPAISVLSAVEGLTLITPQAADVVLPATLGILFALFLVQRHGTGAVSVAFGPITAAWFLILALTGVHHLVQDPAILVAFDPRRAVGFLVEEGPVAFVVLGAIFLAVTGAEALYADLGHFGKAPIRLAWLGLVFPALVLNYLGQGAMVLRHPETVADPFFLLVSPHLLPVLVVLATIATVIASQAVISGAYSMTRSAVQLGFLPRLLIRHTSERQSGQIYIPSVNWLLFAGVVALVFGFRSSAALASAYGIAVTGTMVVTTVLTCVLMLRGWKRPGWQVALVVAPLLALEGAFLASNLLKLPDGGYVPVLVALGLALVMWTWWRGVQLTRSRETRQKVDMDGFAHSIATSERILHAKGTAFFFTSDPTAVPQALLHNLKHNQVLHDRNIILTVETLRIPHCPPEERIEYLPIDERFARLKLRYGFMETPNLSRALGLARRHGLKFDVMTTSFFLGRRKVILGGRRGLGRLLDRLFLALGRFSTDPGEFYSLPRDRVVELGSRITL